MLLKVGKWYNARKGRVQMENHCCGSGRIWKTQFKYGATGVLRLPAKQTRKARKRFCE